MEHRTNVDDLRDRPPNPEVHARIERILQGFTLHPAAPPPKPKGKPKGTQRASP